MMCQTDRMTTYEYRLVTLQRNDEDGIGKVLPKIERELNTLGVNGWEIDREISATMKEGYSERALVMKREAPAASPDVSQSMH